jgi:hypothetical protein
MSPDKRRYLGGAKGTKFDWPSAKLVSKKLVNMP